MTARGIKLFETKTSLVNDTFFIFFGGKCLRTYEVYSSRFLTTCVNPLINNARYWLTAGIVGRYVVRRRFRQGLMVIEIVFT